MSGNPPQPQPDTVTAILVAVTEMKADVRGLVDDLRRHDSEIQQLFSRTNDHGNRIVALETHNESNSVHQDRGLSHRILVWTAISAVFVAVAAIVALVVALRR